MQNQITAEVLDVANVDAKSISGQGVGKILKLHDFCIHGEFEDRLGNKSSEERSPEGLVREQGLAE